MHPASPSVPVVLAVDGDPVAADALPVFQQMRLRDGP
jgi:hypothetical protein